MRKLLLIVLAALGAAACLLLAAVLGLELLEPEAPPPLPVAPARAQVPPTAPGAGLPARDTAPQVLALAREVFGGTLREESCGPYGLLTDSSDAVLIRACGVLAGELDGVVRARFGVAPMGEARGTVLLFARRADFRRFAEADGRVRQGYAGYSSRVRGYVALAAEGPPREEIVRTLAHELTHLVLRRTFGEALPPWLAEGLADAVGDTARPEGFAPLEGWQGVEGPAARLRGIYAGGRAPDLEGLARLDRSGFDRGAASVDYEASALLVRYLLEEPQRAARFRAYLGDLAQGQAYSAEGLRRSLGTGWAELDVAFAAWIAAGP